MAPHKEQNKSIKVDGQEHHMLYLNSCDKIFVQRDFSHGLDIAFETEYPLQLRGKISEEVWTSTIDKINSLFRQAEAITGRTIFETLFGCATCYLGGLCLTPIAYKKMNEIEEYIDSQNRNVFHAADLHLHLPMERGLRVLEFSLVGTHEPLTTQTKPNYKGDGTDTIS